MLEGAAWAFDRHENRVLANDLTVNKDKNGPFRCHCGKNHTLHLTRPSGKPDKRPFEPYFAHTASGFKRKHGVSEIERICFSSGGESKEHMYAKVLLQQRRGHYYFDTHRCKDCADCKTERLSNSSEGDMLLEYRDTETGLVYDCCCVRSCIPVVILEVYNTHACTKDKLEKIKLQRGQVPVGEFDAREVIEALKEIPKEPIKLINRIQDREWLCSSCKEQAEKKEQQAARERAEKQRQAAEKEQQAARERAEKEHQAARERAAKQRLYSRRFDVPSVLHPSDLSTRILSDEAYFVIYPTGFPVGSHPGGMSCKYI